MKKRLASGVNVETLEAKADTRMWAPETIAQRRWHVSGRIVEVSEDNGRIYRVEHVDGALAWYEAAELKPLEDFTYTPEERAEMLRKMQACSDTFYRHVVQAGCHAMIEFTGLMNEFVKVCADAHAAGEQFPFANTHTGVILPFKSHHLAYLAEKLGCIYGPALLANAEGRDAFIDEMFGGAFKLVAVEPSDGPVGPPGRHPDHHQT